MKLRGAKAGWRGSSRVEMVAERAEIPASAGTPHCPDRQRTAAERSITARRMLADCHFCAHHCGVNRLATPAGRCHAGSIARVFSAQVEVADELELIPTFAIAFNGCDLRCAFCITGRQSWNPRAGQGVDLAKLAERTAAALDKGARTVMILGGEPTIHLPTALEIVSVLPRQGRLVWKTNAHGSEQARELLAGVFDVWLADYKFGNDRCALRLAHVQNYTQVVRENLLWSARDAELIIRHLVMPGHVDCCWAPIAEWIAEELAGAKVSLREGFWPGWQSHFHPELRRLCSPAELDRARHVAREFELNLIA